MARRARLALLIVLVLAGLYAALCVLLFVVQRSMIYFPVHEAPAPGATPVRFKTQGADLKLWTVERPGDSALLYFGGNAEDVGASVGRFAERLPELSLFFVNYRGYGGSTGTPTERMLVADAIAIYDRIHERHSHISVVGRSLGSGVAVQLASKRQVARLVLVTPFDSLARVAQEHFPLFPVAMLIRDRFDSVDQAPGISADTLIIVADEDEVIPRARTEALAAAFHAPRVILLKGATHNSVELDRQYFDELAIFLGR